MKIPKNLVIDVDGVMTDGKFYYSKDGKVMKAFGPDDHDALLLLKPHLSIMFVTGDKKGFDISKKRIADDMKFPLTLVSTFERIDWIKEQGLNPKETIYIGDGIFDAMVFKEVMYGIAPANAFHTTKKASSYVTKSSGGDSAVAEACVHIMQKFFTAFDHLNVQIHESSGEWKKKKK